MSPRQAAIAAGEKTYHTGVPCVRDHDAPRYAHTGRCITCVKELWRVYYSKNRDAQRARRTHNPLPRLLSDAKFRAKKAGLPFDLREEDVVLPPRCPVYGTRLEAGGSRRKNSFSLDRIYPSRGYVKGNVTVVSHRVNVEKAFLEPEDLLKYRPALWPFYSQFVQ